METFVKITRNFFIAHKSNQTGSSHSKQCNKLHNSYLGEVCHSKLKTLQPSYSYVRNLQENIQFPIYKEIFGSISISLKKNTYLKCFSSNFVLRVFVRCFESFFNMTSCGVLQQINVRQLLLFRGYLCCTNICQGTQSAV